jgi:hypothetical protein
MKSSPLQQANRRVMSAQRLCAHALDRLRPGDQASMQRLTKASYLLGVARERFVRVAKQSLPSGLAGRHAERPSGHPASIR